MIDRSRNHGVSLIELMLVLAIISVTAGIAWSTSVGNRPKTALVNATSDLRLNLVRVRTTAVKTGRNHKVCLFRDDSPALPAKGRMVAFSCNTPGIAGCPGTPICENDPATAGVQWTGDVDAGPCPSANPDRWCVEPLALDLGASREPVGIGRFLTYQETDTARNSIELTYLPSGSIDRARSTLTSGNIELVNRDLRQRVEFAAGGGARITE